MDTAYSKSLVPSSKGMAAMKNVRRPYGGRSTSLWHPNGALRSYRPSASATAAIQAALTDAVLSSLLVASLQSGVDADVMI